MKNKRVVIILSSLIVLIGGILFANQIYNKSKNKHIPKKNNLAIMIKGESGEYISSDAIPKGNYVLNEEKTICENNGKVLNYDSATGKVSFSFVGSDRCSLYFDKIIDNEKPVISNLVVNGTTITATLTDNIELSSYGISTSNNVEPTSWTSISGTSYNLSITITTEGTYYLWVKDSSDNKTYKEFTISLGTSFETLIVANNNDIFDENGLRYEGADPKNYICLDNQKEGSCTSSSLLFRIIGLFDEDTSSDGTTSNGTKKLLKVIDTNVFGDSDGKQWSGSSSVESNNWSRSLLKTQLNNNYLSTIFNTTNVNEKLINSILISKWHLGGQSYSNYSTITVSEMFDLERNTGTVYSGNPSSVYEKVGLMYPSDYGYATTGGTTVSKNECASTALYNLSKSTYSDCINNNWIYNSQTITFGSHTYEWLISPAASNSYDSSILRYGAISTFQIENHVYNNYYQLRPTFYLDSSLLKVVGGTGTSTDPYHIG